MIKRRPRKSIEQWKTVIADQQASDSSRLDYCLKHDIHIVTFSARLSENNSGLNARSNVAPESIDKPQLVKISTPLRKAEREYISIAFADVEVPSPMPVQADWFVKYSKAYSHEDVCRAR
jgi:hypothetical protein